MEVFKGKVIWFNPRPEFGYGFIKWDGGEDMFVHFSDVNIEGFKTLKKDQNVSFSIGKNNKGDPKAIEVNLLNE